MIEEVPSATNYFVPNCPLRSSMPPCWLPPDCVPFEPAAAAGARRARPRMSVINPAKWATTSTPCLWAARRRLPSLPAATSLAQLRKTGPSSAGELYIIVCFLNTSAVVARSTVVLTPLEPPSLTVESNAQIAIKPTIHFNSFLCY